MKYFLAGLVLLLMVYVVPQLMFPYYECYTCTWYDNIYLDRLLVQIVLMVGAIGCLTYSFKSTDSEP